MSDIHGCFRSYWEMLRRIRLSDEDTLYVLGDAIDRGPKGIDVLLDMASRPNVVGLLGNHELNAIRALPLIVRARQNGGVLECTPDEYADLQLWLYNGGESTIRQFEALNPKKAALVWNYICNLERYREIEVDGRKFVLIHTGPENFSKEKDLSEYTVDEVTFSRPSPETRYFEDRTMVFGHTPTRIMYDMQGRHPSPDRIFYADTYIDIDCGAVFGKGGGRLGCLCLDTMEEVYVPQTVSAGQS